ncbi:MAG: hypothetical protein KC657_00800 [Myxococcales bacterium]|nr:hypothetical protein [Myxococcales bacterium]
MDRALAQARRQVAGSARKDTRRVSALALVPVVVAALLILLLFPHATAPEAVPMPLVDDRLVSAVERSDDAIARDARARGLPSQLRAVGSAIRAVHTSRVAGVSEAELFGLTEHLGMTIADLGARGEIAELARLRAVQLEAFLREARALERTGASSPELIALAGDFATHMRSVGWLERGELTLDDHERRVVYKAMWNAMVALPQVKELALTLDETRVLYRLYLRKPHAPDLARAAGRNRRAMAMTDEACALANADEVRASELWRADKIRLLGKIDPTYPTAFALGVVYYRAGDFARSSDAFSEWIDKHPTGPWSLRARNHLRAALKQYGAL